MKITSIIAIYAMFWVLAAFLVMPFGIRTHEEAGEATIKGQANSAPANFQPRKIARRATILSLLMFGLYYANYVNGWLGPQDFDLTQVIGDKPDLPKSY
jgi:predicted secreted protein